jgi:hypothetical protein
MRRVVLKTPLTTAVNVVRTGPNPNVIHVAEQLGELCAWIECDQVSTDLSDPVYRTHELRLYVIGTGWVGDRAVEQRHEHLGSVVMSTGMVWHIYTVPAHLLDDQKLQQLHGELHRTLYRTEVGQAIRSTVIARDLMQCRVCGTTVSFKLTSRHAEDGVAYIFLDVQAPLSADNVVLSCRRCSARKGYQPLDRLGMTLRPLSGVA